MQWRRRRCNRPTYVFISLCVSREDGSPALDLVVLECSGGDAGVTGPRMYLSHDVSFFLVFSAYEP